MFPRPPRTYAYEVFEGDEAATERARREALVELYRTVRPRLPPTEAGRAWLEWFRAEMGD